MIKKILVIEGQYFACINYITTLNISSDVKIELYETFQKMTFRNRCILATDKGLINLSVPLKNGRGQKCLITEVEIDNSQLWQRQHWRTIVSCYRKAPFFDYYAKDVEELIFADNKYLLNFNMSILMWLKRTLKLYATISFTEEFIYMYDEPGIADFRNRWLPKNFQEEDGITVKKYGQVFENKIGFQRNLSILDLIFCEGPNAGSYL